MYQGYRIPDVEQASFIDTNQSFLSVRVKNCCLHIPVFRVQKPCHTSGTPIFGICLVYTTYIPCVCRPLQYTWNVRGISIDIPWISNGVYINGISMDIPLISTNYIPGISMDMHGISFDVYTWYIRGISMDIPSIL
jgi:hypothetical protein